MGEAVSEFIIDVSEQEFENAVIERSRQVPVLVDFWAPWCGPCKTLGPVLESLAEEFNGAFILARINTDENQTLAGQLGIRGIPNVWLFRDGEVVDQFVGVQPEQTVREFLRRYCPTDADRLVLEGNRYLEQGQDAPATEAFSQALAADSQQAGAHLGLARLALRQGNQEAVEAHVAAIPPLADEAEAAERIREALTFSKECEIVGGETAARERLTANPDDLDARFGLASCLTVAERYPEALEEFLAIIAKEKSYRDEAARKAMLTIFSLVGERSELAEEYRKRLAWTLY